MVDATNPYADLIPPAGASATPPVTGQGTPANPYADLIPQRPPNWSITGPWYKGGDVTLPQPLQDFGDVMGENASAGAVLPMARMEAQQKGQTLDLPTQMAQLNAAKTRLGPVGSGVAETLGSIASPTSLLNWVPIPGVGGVLAGASHEGLKSYFEGGDAAGDALKGGISGGLAHGVSSVLANPHLLAGAADLLGTGGGMAAVHGLFGDSPAATMLGGQWGSRVVQPLVKKLEEGGGSLANALRPYLTTAIQGPASAIQQTPGNPWSQWVPGQ